MTLRLLEEEVNWEETQYLPPGWMASEGEGRGLGVREGLNLRHQDLQQCLCSKIMHTMTLRLLEEEVNWEETQYLPPGWMASEGEGRGLGVREGLNLRHQDLQQCLCSKIMHTMTLRLLEEEVNWEETQDLLPGWMASEGGKHLFLG